MSLIQLAYISRSRLGSEDAMWRPRLERIISSAREHNARNGITGYLMFDGVEFAQILEGDPSAVMGTFLRISANHQHDSIEVLMRGPLLERRFTAWDMGLAVREGPLETVFERMGMGEPTGFCREPLSRIIDLAVEVAKFSAAA
jgi:Sensors of blue-light using FAD